QARAEPSARRAAGELTDGLSGFDDIGAFVGNFLHVLLTEPMAHELPAAFMSGTRDGFVRGNSRAVDRQDSTNTKPSEVLQHPPDANAVPVFVPGPIRNIRLR